MPKAIQDWQTVRLMGAKGEAVEYPLDPSLPRYERVLVIIEGTYQVSGPSYPGGYPVTKERMQRLVETYDPVGFYAAPINVDHDNFWGGPALGIVTALSYEEVDGLGHVYADVAICDPLLAYQIDRGMWPARSMEWHDAEAISSWLQEPVEDCLFYDEHDLYFTGMAFLGQFEPAIPKMGPMPPRAQRVEEPGEQPSIVTLPLAAASPRQDSITRLTIPPKEGQPMPGWTKQATKATGPPTGEPAAVGKPDAEQLAKENEELKAQLAEVQSAAAAAQADQQEKDELQAALTQEREKREEFEARYEAREREAEVNDRLSAHRKNGRLTTDGQRKAYVALAAQLHGRESTEVLLAKAGTLKPERSPLDLLDAIIAGFPAQVKLGAYAASETADDSDSPAVSPQAAAREKAIEEQTAALQKGNGNAAGGDA